VASKIDWKLVKPQIVANEAIQASLILFTLAIGVMKLPMLFALWLLELIIVCALTTSFYPERRKMLALADIAKVTFAFAVLGVLFYGFFYVFLNIRPMGSYFGADGELRSEFWSLLSAAALLALRLSYIARAAKKNPQPKLAWSRAAMARGVVVMVGMVLCVFPGVFLVLPLASALSYIVPNVAADLAMGIVVLTIQIFFVAMISTMSEAEFESVFGNPYVD
jgi:hypothetical protein